MVATTNQMVTAFLVNAFQAYIIYRLMHIFFERASRWGKMEYASYAFYWALNSIVYIGLDNPLGIFFINIALYYSLTRQYSRQWKERSLAAILILGVLMLSEASVTSALSGLGFKDHRHYDDKIYLISQYATQTISYIVVLLYSSSKRSRQAIEIPGRYWCALILVPASTLCIAATFSLMLDSQYIYLMMICIGVMFGLNLMIFYLYTSLQKEYQEKLDSQMLAQQNKLDNDLLAQQNEAYVKELNLAADANERVRMMRHNTINHVSALRKLISQSKNEEALQYLARVEDEITVDEAAIFHTGNLIVDGILNAKLSAIQQDQITIEQQINIPDRLAIEPFDLSVIIGNLMDNAIEAIRQLPIEQRQIKLQLTYDSSVLYLFVSNPCGKELEIHNGLITSTKADHDNHGLGLKSVYRSVQRYPGSLAQIETEEGWFHADIILYEPAQ